ILYLGQALFALERFEEALEAFERSVARNREALPAHLYLTACLGLMGEEERAKEALREVFRIYPGFSPKWAETYLPYKQQVDAERLLSGLRKAGLSG
ncbi:MAG: tetratricopeptide repeat protein, partial [Hyphomicrobiales bacterium]